MKIGDIVKLTLLDHARKNDLIKIIAYGEVKEIDPIKVTIVMWKVLDEDLDNNNEEMSIVRCCIVKEEILEVKNSVVRRNGRMDIGDLESLKVCEYCGGVFNTTYLRKNLCPCCGVEIEQ